MMFSFYVVFLFIGHSNKIVVLCLQKCLPNICVMLLNYSIVLKMIGLKIIKVTFLIIFELLFSQRFEIH